MCIRDSVNGDQEIEAPANARPLSDLTESLGGGALDGLGATGGGEETTPVAPADSDPPNAGAGGDGSGGSAAPAESPEAEAFREYSECLDGEGPEDTEALQRCADLLQP